MPAFNVDYEKYFGNDLNDDGSITYYDEVDILEFKYYRESRMFSYPCPCGDLFLISLEDMENGEITARCPSCSLMVRVVYEDKDIARYR